MTTTTTPTNPDQLATLVDPHAERAALQCLQENALLLGADAVRRDLDGCGLTPEDFGHPTTRAAWREVAAMVRAGDLPDLTLLWPRVRHDPAFQGKEGWGKFTQLLMGGNTSHLPMSLQHYAQRVKELAARRRLVQAARELLGSAMDERVSVSAALMQGTAALNGITAGGSRIRTLTEYVAEVEAELVERMDSKKLPVLSSGLRDWDRLIGGLQPTLIVMGAMAGVGKSSVVAYLLKSLALRQHNSFICSLEDPGEWLVYRGLASESQVDQFVLRYRIPKDEQWGAIGEGFAQLRGYSDRILVDDRGGLTPDEVLAALRDAIVNRGARLGVVDNMTSMSWPREKNERGDEARRRFLLGVRDLAGVTKTPIIVVSHIKRREGLTVDKLPQLTDFSEASAIENCSRVAVSFARVLDGDGSDVLMAQALKVTNGKGGRTWGMLFKEREAMVADLPLERARLLAGGAPAAKPPVVRKAGSSEVVELLRKPPPTQSEAFTHVWGSKEDGNV